MRPAAAGVVELLRARGETLACAESLTGGLVSAAVTDVPGASVVLRGAVVAYATDVKAGVLGVEADLLDREGAVHPDVARQMAQGARRVLGGVWGVATTGVAGPDAQDGRPVGTVYVAVAGPTGTTVRAESFRGDRAAIRESSVGAALALLLEVLDAAGGPLALTPVPG